MKYFFITCELKGAGQLDTYLKIRGILGIIQFSATQICSLFVFERPVENHKLCTCDLLNITWHSSKLHHFIIWRCPSWPHLVVDKTSFSPPSSHPFNNTTAHAILPEKQKHSGPVTHTGSHWMEASGVLICFGIINRLLALPLRTADLLCAEHGHVNSLRRGWVIRFVSTSISIPSNCCTVTTATFPDGTAHSGLSPEPISLQPAATSGVGNILITYWRSPEDGVDSRHTLLFAPTFPTFPVDHPESTVLLFQTWNKQHIVTPVWYHRPLENQCMIVILSLIGIYCYTFGLRLFFMIWATIFTLQLKE